MKTQLLQDLNDNGSAQAGPPPPSATVQPDVRPEEAAAPRPAVWRQPRQAPPETPGAVASGAAAPDAVAGAAVPPATPAASGAPAPPDAVQPTAPAFARPAPIHITPPPGARVSLPSETTIPLPGTGAGGGDPDWLTERLARDAATHSSADWSGRWGRRLAASGAAAVLLALVAGGGLWLYEQSQVEGALVVVANTNPASELPAARPTAGSAATAASGTTAPIGALPSTSAPATLPVPAPAPAEAPAPVAPEAAQKAGGVDADRTVKSVPLAEAPATAPPKRTRSHSHSRKRTQAAATDSAPSARQRREETLMQCRAHGYDERECLARGCEMTRYGFACKG
ncbi:hypothetical protein [Massilia sp. WF1]|uniref:hypothetical protein n=2 Tax=unclassified Massilia TaxID=2609279 RepID=UPI0012E0EBDF|nr:hypothetical protein [Massilia sp. WF1]